MRNPQKEIHKIADFAPSEVEAGVGLALQDDSGRYMFFLAGTRHHAPAGELFYAGIGGHRESGEDWLACAHREAKEEIGTDVEILPAQTTWHISQHGAVQKFEVVDHPRPLAFYEMIHPAGTPRAGEVYRIVIYQARLQDVPKNMPPDEILGVIALTTEQVRQGPERKPTLAELLAEGGSMVAGAEGIERGIRLYPFGTAVALAYILNYRNLLS
jgi:8-oxo-dGTP pyrophosphatase MutT (NUDIX family)